MFAKLIFRNVKRNLQTYSIYFATLTIIYSLLYSFNAVISNPILNEVSETKKILSRFMGQFMGVLSIFGSFAFVFLVLYSTQFVLKRRSKELGLYSSLGMKNKKIGRILFFENLIVNFNSLILGFVLGWFISILLTKALIHIFALKGLINYFYISRNSVIITCVCFVVIVLISSIFNRIRINKISIIALLKEDEIGNREIKVDTKKQVIGMIISLVCLMISFYLIYTLQDMSSIKNRGYAILIISMIGVIGFYYTLGSSLIGIVKRMPKIYYKSSNTILIRELSSESNKNSITISVISIFLTLAFSVVLIGGSSYISMNREINNSSPYNLSIISSKPLKNKQFLDELKTKGINSKANFSSYLEFYTYASDLKYKDLGIEDKELWQIDKGLENQRVSVISLSDFNKILQMQGQKQIHLKKNEYLINCNYKGTLPRITNFLKADKHLNLNGVLLKPNFKKPLPYTIIMTSVGNNDRGTLIVSDNVIKVLDKDDSVLNAIYNTGVDERKVTRIINDYVMEHTWSNDSGLQFDYKYQTKDRLKDMFSGTMGAIVFLTMFIGLIFTLISLCILSIHTTTNAINFKRDARIINSLGLKYENIQKLLLKEVIIYFVIPCIVAIPGGVLIGKKIIDFFEIFLNFTIRINPGVLGMQILMFTMYILMTYSISKKIIRD